MARVLWPQKVFWGPADFLHFFFFIKRCVAGFGGCVCVSAKCQMQRGNSSVVRMVSSGVMGLVAFVWFWCGIKRCVAGCGGLCVFCKVPNVEGKQ